MVCERERRDGKCNFIETCYGKHKKDGYSQDKSKEKEDIKLKEITKMKEELKILREEKKTLTSKNEIIKSDIKSISNENKELKERMKTITNIRCSCCKEIPNIPFKFLKCAHLICNRNCDKILSDVRTNINYITINYINYIIY